MTVKHLLAKLNLYFCTGIKDNTFCYNDLNYNKYIANLYVKKVYTTYLELAIFSKKVTRQLKIIKITNIHLRCYVIFCLEARTRLQHTLMTFL